MSETRVLSQTESPAKQATLIELLPFSAQERAARKWQELEQQIGNTGLTNSWSWVKIWLEHYADTVRPVFAFGVQDGQPIGAAVITQAIRGRMGITIPALYLGTAGEPRQETAYVEYNRLLVAPQHLDDFAQALLLTLQQRFRWSELWLVGFVPEHAEALMRAGAQVGLAFTVAQEPSPAFVFQQAAGEGNQDFLSTLGKNTRYHIRRSMRLFERTFGPQRVEWAETPADAKAMLQDLIHLHQQRWQRVGYPGAFQSERVRRHHESLIDDLMLWPQGAIAVVRVAYGETTIGCLYHLIDEGSQVLYYKGGFAQFEDNKLQPGLVTLALCIAECQRRGFAAYDFLVGDYRYKAELSNTERRLIWATAPRGLRGWLLKNARPCLQFAAAATRGLRGRARKLRARLRAGVLSSS
jgi:CelD/BcsL family acetyltransferase involved in cellulose biosynthesis